MFIAFVIPFNGGEAYQLTDFAVDINSMFSFFDLKKSVKNNNYFFFSFKKNQMCYILLFKDLQWSPAGNAISFTASVYLEDVI